MLSAIPSQYHLFIGIGGLVILLLLITGFAQRYQAYQLEKQAAIRRILRGVQQVESVLSRLEGSAIPKQLSVLLNKEVLARYMAIYQIHKKLENLNTLLSRAQQSLAAAESRVENALTTPPDKAKFAQYVHGLTELINFLRSQGHIAGMNPVERRQYQSDLEVLRAEYVSLFYSDEASKLAEKNLWNEAARKMKEALQIFQSFGTAEPRVNELYIKTNQFYKQVLNREIPGITPEKTVEEQEAVAQPAGAVN